MDGSRNDGIYILFMESHKIGVSSIHIDRLHTLHTYEQRQNRRIQKIWKLEFGTNTNGNELRKHFYS